MDKLLNVQEVADILKIARNTVYELIKRGELNCSKVGKQMRISQSEVDDYLRRTMEKMPRGAGTEGGTAEGAAARAVVSAAGQDEMIRGNELIICGQDVSLDILITHLTTKYDGIPAYRSHLASYNGIYALYQGKVNVATAHLWDGDTNEYNVSYIKKMMPGTPAMIVRIGQRMEGFYVPAGNPKNLRGWEDLKREDLTLANREKGSGVRVLIDEKLRLMGIPGDKIKGYHKEHKTHLAVATAVATGLADVGIGSEKSSLTMKGIDFIPLQMECYDLVIRKSDAGKPQFQALLEIVASEAFKRDIAEAAGFDVSRTGSIILA
jgi:putative molybdopterin biosynthesis protein